MKTCNICGGLKATENLEMIAGTICKCPIKPEAINLLPDLSIDELKLIKYLLKQESRLNNNYRFEINCIIKEIDKMGNKYYGTNW